MDMQKTLTESIRWYVLVAVNSGRPEPVSETLILSAIQSIPIDCSALVLRREFDYLERRGLVTIKRLEVAPWLVGLSWAGVDILEYTTECGAGIARPKKYWSS